ncbi:MAG: hypothetical protein ACTHKK_09660 [Candidatus Nitrosocosmicus sp.]
MSLMSSIIPLKIKYNKSESDGSIKIDSKKMHECNPCKNSGFPNQYISFEKIENPTTGKNIWKPIDEEGNEHKHKFTVQNNKREIFQRKKIVDIDSVTDIQEAKKLLLEGWEYKTSYPVTVSNLPHFILIKSE